MAHFVVHYRYVDDSDLLTRVRPVHREFTAGLFQRGVMLAGGPTVDEPQPSAFLICTAQDRQELEGILDQDPFALQGVLAERIVTQWNPVTGVFAADATV